MIGDIVGLAGMPSRPRERPLDWVRMASAFDAFVMDPNQGVMFVNGRGHTVFTAFLEGQTDPDAKHELVSYGPITLGKLLRGDDVTELLPALAGYFNETTGIYMNGPHQDRIEMWYLMYANALAAHLTRRALRHDDAAMRRWRSSADRLRAMARNLNYDFNHQGYNFTQQAPWTRKDIYRQPDGIGGYAYLMLMAYESWNETEYLEEALRALDLYLAFDQNPWYEVPCGAMAAIAAARLHALGYDTDVQQALEHVLDPSAGMVMGSWGEREVHGLYRGWRFSQPESAYSMESLVPLPYLLPIARYDPRFARSLGKYALHVAANARLFYSEYMRGSESRGDLSPVVAFERLYQSYEACSPYAAGDCLGHKSIYGGAYALHWGALVKPTADPYILQLDLASSDFLSEHAYPTYLYSNPWDSARTVYLEVRDKPVDVYDVTQHCMVGHGVMGRVPVELDADSARVIALVPPNRAVTHKNGRLIVGGIVVDYEVDGGS